MPKPAVVYPAAQAEGHDVETAVANVEGVVAAELYVPKAHGVHVRSAVGVAAAL